jgi:hypothetical protein
VSRSLFSALYLYLNYEVIFLCWFFAIGQQERLSPFNRAD